MLGYPTSDALEWINRARDAFKLPPLLDLPKGRRRSPCDCPIALALAACGVERVEDFRLVFGTYDDARRVYIHMGYQPGYQPGFQGGRSLRLVPGNPVRDWVYAFDGGLSSLQQYARSSP